MEEDWEGKLEIDLDLGLPVPKLLDGKGLVSVMKLFVSNLNIKLCIRFRDCKFFNELKWGAFSRWSFGPNSAWSRYRDNEHREDASHFSTIKCLISCIS